MNSFVRRMKKECWKKQTNIFLRWKNVNGSRHQKTICGFNVVVCTSLALENPKFRRSFIVLSYLCSIPIPGNALVSNGSQGYSGLSLVS